MLLDGLNPGVIPMSTVYVGEKIQVNCALNILSFKITEYCFLRGCQIPIFNNWILIFAMLIHSGVFLKTFFLKIHSICHIFHLSQEQNVLSEI
jgi:hypothetical protein